MASTQPRLHPKPIDSAAAREPAARREHVHVVSVDGAWAMRLGRRIEQTFQTRLEAMKAAIPFARGRECRLFVHYDGGVVRETGTELTDELLLEMWQMVYDDHHANAD